MRREVAVQDLRALLEYLTASNAQYALAGGLAVGLWAEHLLADDQKERLKIPVYSEDVDFRGYRFLADGISPKNEQGSDLEHLKILATLLPAAEKLARSRGVRLKHDAERLHAILANGEFPLPFSGPEEEWITQAIEAAMQEAI